MDTIISHPGVQHVYYVVEALQKSGRLKKFYTSFYNKNPSLLSHHLLKRRLHKVINTDKVVNIPYYEIIERLFKSTNTFVYWRDRMFDKHVSYKVKNENVIGYLNACKNTFKKTSGVKILDAAIAYYKDADLILNEEKKLSPEWADSIGYIDFPESYKKRVDEEIKMADNIIVASEFSKKSYLKHGVEENKLITIPYGSWMPASNEIRKSRDNEPLKIVFFGQISQRKGIKYLLDAFKELKDEELNIELTLIGGIIGSGKALKNYKNYFTHIPFVDKNKLKKYLDEQDLFIFPSLFEGFGITILDAMARGIPVITTRNTGCEAIEEGKSGFIIPIRNVEAIKNRIVLLYENRNLLNMMKEEALERSKLFTKENYIKNLNDFFKKI